MLPIPIPDLHQLLPQPHIMAPVYADHPFPIITTPEFANKKAGLKTDMFDHCASEMACVHNMMVRSLNAIYLQAPHIKPADEKSFCAFILHWYALLSVHHHGEEEEFFPDIEAMTGEKGIMEANVEQHHAFHEGLAAFHEYVKACAAGSDKYDGRKVVSMVDSFGPTLMQHLTDEIPTIQGLRKYGEEKMANLQKRFNAEGEKNMVRYVPCPLIT
jgi:hemerythrin-like domain-containing protein